jgi:hypothetical protein
MLMKAHRCRSGVDLYRPARSVLSTIYQDEETQRSRQIKSEDESVIESLWDKLQAIRVDFAFTDIEEKNYRPLDLQKETPIIGIPAALKFEEPHRNLYYNDTDALEDSIMFPEELTSGRINPFEIGKIEQTRSLDCSLAKLVEGLDLVESDDEKKNPSDLEEQGPADSESSEETSVASSERFSDIEEVLGLEIEANFAREATLEKVLGLTKKTSGQKIAYAKDPTRMMAEYMTSLDREKSRSKSRTL